MVCNLYYILLQLYSETKVVVHEVLLTLSMGTLMLFLFHK